MSPEEPTGTVQHRSLIRDVREDAVARTQPGIDLVLAVLENTRVIASPIASSIVNGGVGRCSLD